jgi:hypothetical protein
MLTATSSDFEIIQHLMLIRGQQPYGMVTLNLPAPIVDRIIGMIGEAMSWRSGSSRPFNNVAIKVD